MEKSEITELLTLSPNEIREKVNWDQLKPFQKKVFEELIKVKAGETVTYSELAKRIGNPKAARAVGNAMNKNPFPIIIPCHRVVGSNGSLTGYALGLKRKAELLQLEKELTS